MRLSFTFSISCLLIIFLALNWEQSFSQINKRFFIVENITVSGNEKTKEFVVLRELPIKTGDTISIDKLSAILNLSRNNLLKTSLFNFVTISYTTINNTISINILLEERWYLWPYPILEHADRNLSSWIETKDIGKINYGACFIQHNFRGRREILKIKTRLGYREQYSILYQNPYLGKNNRNGINIEAAYYRQHEILFQTKNNKPDYYRTDDDYILHSFNSNISYQYRKHLVNTHSITGALSYHKIADTIVKLNPFFFQFYKSNLLNPALSYQFSRDCRDSKVYPLEGYLFSFSGIKQWLIAEKNKQSINSSIALLNFYTRLSDNFFWGTDIKGKYTFNGEYPYYLNKALGYNDFLRGYEYYIIDGKHFFTSKMNLKYEIMAPRIKKIDFIPLSKFNKIHYAIYANCFFDYGYVADGRYSDSNNMINSPQYSAGIGIDFVTYYDKIFRIEYSINKFGNHGIYFLIGAPILSY